MTRPANTFGAAVSENGRESPAVTDLDSSQRADSADDVAAELRTRAECVRRRELDTALDRLEARGDLTPEERRLVARLSAGIADALVERWVAGLAEVDEDAAVALFSE